MKTKEELNALKGERDTLSKKLSELSEDELNQVVGGSVDDLIQSYNDDVRHYMDAILNPEAAYHSH